MIRNQKLMWSNSFTQVSSKLPKKGNRIQKLKECSRGKKNVLQVTISLPHACNHTVCFSLGGAESK